MRRLKLLIVLLLFPCITVGAVLYVSGLTVYRYYYISLAKGQGIEAIEYGSPKLDGLYFAGPIPLLYRKAGEEYVVVFDVRDDSFRPRVVISIVSSAGTLFARRSARLPHGRCLRNFLVDISTGKEVQSFEAVEIDDRGLGFSWVSCEAGEFADDRVLSFDIVDGENNLLGKEDIPFELVRNGLFLEFDAL